MATKEKPATTQAEYEKAWEEVKSGKQKAPSFNDMSPTQKETLMTKEDKASEKQAAKDKADYLKDYGKGLKDELDEYKTSGKLLNASKSHPWGQGIQEMSDAIRAERTRAGLPTKSMKKGGAVKYKKGGSVSSASRRADGCATKGKTKGRII